MSHPAWHGFSHHDTIFPLFLFIAGISYPFSLAKQRSLGATQGDLYRKILKRGALLILFGLIYNGLFRLDWPMRTASVLGRIAWRGRSPRCCSSTSAPVPASESSARSSSATGRCWP